MGDFMKKIKFILFCSLFSIFSMTLFANQQASVVSVQGKVEVQRNGSWIPLKEGDLISEGELLNTGFKSEAVIKYEGSVMKMGPMTRVTLEKLSSTPVKDTVSVYLKTGALRSTVSHAAKKTQQTTRSATAVASVRGTDYVMTAEGRVIVNTGAVATMSAEQYAASVNQNSDSAPKDCESSPNTASEDINPDMDGAVTISEGYEQDYSDTDGQYSSQSTSSTESNYSDFSSQFATGSDREMVNDSTSTNSSSSGKRTGTLNITVKLPSKIE